MDRYAQYLTDYRAEKATHAELLAFTGEELAHAIARLADATDSELPQAALYALEVGDDHCRQLADAAMPDQAAAAMIGLLFVLLHRRVNPETLAGPYCRALTDIVFTAFAAAQKAQSQGDAFACEHWTAIVLQQVALAAVTLRAIGTPELTDNPRAAKIFEIAAKDPSVPTTWPTNPTPTAPATPITPRTATPITPRTAIDILGDSTSRLLAMNLLA